jgi:FkbM family methyltransferase
LLVEALPQLADKLRDNYKGYNTDISVHSCAVSDKNGTADFYFLENTNLRLSSLLPNVHSDFMRGTSKITVPTLTFDSLCAKHSMSKVDVLFVDIEGYDEDVISTIDFAKYNIGTLVWEYNHSRRRNPKQHEALKQKCMDYGMVQENRGMNIIMTKIGTEKYNITLQ